MKPLPIKPNLTGAAILRMRRVTSGTRPQAIAMECRFQLLSKLKFRFKRRSNRREAHMKQSRLRATLTDPHLWIPLVVLAFGIGLLAALA
jgi:hypothetical protein